VSLALASNSNAPGRAREALRDVPEFDAIRDDATLVVSELVTDAVTHPGITDQNLITLSVFLEGDRVMIHVHDPAPADVMPPLRDLRREVGGPGLRLVPRIALRSGIECRDGRNVWAELALGNHRA
jgi:anti-sigma regulatory factor (Ser/Thr protein kinase)